MTYRELHMTEIKEILLRVGRNESVRSISKTLDIHRDTINKYISIAYELGIDLAKGEVTNELIEKIKQRLLPWAKPSSIPRDDILLPHKDRIEAYLGKDIKGSNIMILLARDGITVNGSSFYRFINYRCENHMKKAITVRLPKLVPVFTLRQILAIWEEYGTRTWEKQEKRVLSHQLILTS